MAIPPVKVGVFPNTESLVIDGTADSSVVLATANTPVILTSGAALGALAINPNSTHPENYDAAAGEYTLANNGRILVSGSLRGAKTVSGSIVTLRLRLGSAGDLAGVGEDLLASVVIPAAALTDPFLQVEFSITAPVTRGRVLTWQLESDTDADALAITQFSMRQHTISDLQGAAV